MCRPDCKNGWIYIGKIPHKPCPRCNLKGERPMPGR